MTGIHCRSLSLVLMAGLTFLCLCQTAQIKRVMRRSVTCDRSDFACNGGCIPNSWACDGDPDCSDGEDELPSLCVNRVCPDTYYKCDDTKCIPCEDINDGFPDCIDNSDEENNASCTAPHPTT
ncbi:very low-density lipoprotein receptor-like [Mizuhopecten yessoensis]|uniref:Very low-density lipoprotein receptor n=1 Tax=Mizuhopecten yessoensis TaxID=6573 RepID=A0A210QRB5_MIZYE|nr:very low-density lipoprotein receptor-like [Mizuhopecten yessoensis]OWF51259.1 Very low-density lipoprotein receptor [Mizuhopecten yessoensis]